MSYYPNTKGSIPNRYDAREGDVIGDNYEVVSTLGSGSYGQVLKVAGRDGKYYALKLLRLWDVPSDIRQALIDRFEVEYDTGRIVSNNLVQSVDKGYLNGNPYIVMEFCSGGDLSKLIGRRDVDFARYASDILLGLGDLHKHGKVHRDLKPENVLLREDGTAVLTDFGISGDRNHRMTHRNIFGRPDQIFGTYAYMAPEQANRERGGSTVLPTTDIFSFGVVLFQMLTGKLPFGELENENDLANYLKRAKSGEWQRSLLHEIPDGDKWMSLIEGCLNPSWKNRIQSADEAIRMIPSVGQLPRPQSSDSTGTPAGKDVGHRAGTFLQVTVGDLNYDEFDLNDIIKNKGRRIVTIGRESSNDVVLQNFGDAILSRRHATIEEVGDDAWVIRDGQWIPEQRRWQNSSNGTFLNSVQIGQEGQILKDGDIVVVGDINCKMNIIK